MCRNVKFSRSESMSKIFRHIAISTHKNVEISCAETMSIFIFPQYFFAFYKFVKEVRRTDGHTLAQTLLKDASRIKNILENIILDNSSVCVEHTRFAACNFGLVLSYRCIIKAEYCRGYFSNIALIYFRRKEKAIFIYIWCKNVKKLVKISLILERPTTFLF